MKSGLLEEIKARIDIVEFISDYVALKKSGQNYKGLCPFHSEKTPSFMVSPSKQIFHCFGCGAGGDVITFFMKHDHLSFGEAVRYIAKKAGIDVPDTVLDKNAAARRDGILKANEAALRYFVSALRETTSALAYLAERGVSDAMRDLFRIGYAPDRRDGLYRALKKKGFSDPILKNAGLIAADGGGPRDWFRGRIMFPIRNLRDEIIGFGGRAIGSGIPKYLNTPETDVFKKGEALFALDLAKGEIRRRGYAIVVEGYLDAIMCHQHGFSNAVAPLGTALTHGQLRKLKSSANTVILVFDGDDAGVSAAKRAVSGCCELDIAAKVLLLPRGEDPDSILRKSGAAFFEKALSSARSPVDFLLETAKGERVDVVREALTMIATVKDLLRADEFVRELSDRSKMHETALRSELELLRKKARAPERPPLPRPASTTHREELLLLSILLSFPEKSRVVLPHVNLEDIRNETIRRILRKISERSEHGTVGSLLSEADEAEAALISSLTLNPGFDPEHVDANVADCLARMRERRTDRERRLAEESGDIVRLDSILKEKRKRAQGTRS